MNLRFDDQTKEAAEFVIYQLIALAVGKKSNESTLNYQSKRENA